MGGRNVLAIDLGASSGRAVLGRYDGEKLETVEVHRFANEPVRAAGTLYWDTLGLLKEIRQSILNARDHGGFESLAVDTWGVDYGLLDKNGGLLGNPVHYRDGRTDGMPEVAAKMVSSEQFYAVTGTEQMAINTVYQLLAERAARPEWFGLAGTMLMTPDLLNYLLTGQRYTEASIASTSQLFDAQRRDWSEELINALGLPRGLFAPVVPSGTVVGRLSGELCEELCLENEPKVIAVCSHDTQSALVAVPAQAEDFAFISCGTWALCGTELDGPVLTGESRRLNLTNECGYGGKTAYLKNITGLWLVQESRRQWIREGTEYGFQEIEDLAELEIPLRSFINPNEAAFATPGNLPRRIRAWCEQTGQPVPEGHAAVVRCINESLALQFRKTLTEISGCTGKAYHTIHMLGGGAKSPMLCRMTADACGCTVLAGPNEATVWGNLAVQLIALGELPGLQAARDMIRSCGRVTSYAPDDTRAWDEPYETFRRLATC